MFPNGAAALADDNVDEYSDGAIMSGTAPINENLNKDVTTLPWAGSDNPFHYFSTQDFFDPNKTSDPPPALFGAFVNRLMNCGLRTNSYDRYTYYRMLEQLGTDSAPIEDKININHVNVNVAGDIVPDAETNLIPWRAIQFFTNAANRVLRMNSTIWEQDNPRDYFGTFGMTEAFGATNIPVLVTYTTVSNSISVTREVYGYTPAVHRLLQVVANVYDATTNQADLTPYPYLPHVYRPIFRRNPGSIVTNVFIAGFQEVVDTSIILGASAVPMVDLTSVAERQNIPDVTRAIGTVSPEPMVYGVPLIIGARKGFPNFNKFALENIVRVTRKLLFRRSAAGDAVTQTNQMYSLAISNAFGMQAWNSYGTTFPRQLAMIAWGEILDTSQIQDLVGYIRVLGKADLAPSGATRTFTADIKPIFDSMCSSCHGSKGGWDASSYDSVMKTGNHAPVVKPGDFKNSLLMQKILGTQTDGDIMPPTDRLSDAQVQAILDWIATGAAEK